MISESTGRPIDSVIQRVRTEGGMQRAGGYNPRMSTCATGAVTRSPTKCFVASMLIRLFENRGNAMKDRLTELEIKLGFAEDLLDAMNRTLFRQQQQIDQMHRDMRELRSQLESSLPGDRNAPADDVPPHY